MPRPPCSRLSAALSVFAVFVAVAAPAGTAQAALVARNGGMVYDTTLDITWLADWNYAKTSGHDADGLMNWGEAKDWADNLVFGGYDDWRLPTIGQPDTTCSFNYTVDGVTAYVGSGCTAREFAHLFHYDLGPMPGTNSLSEVTIANRALLTNFKSSDYWSQSEFAPLAHVAWATVLNGVGSQSIIDKRNGTYAVAVRNGDVASAVPEPGTAALVLLALTLGGALRRGSLEPMYRS